ncbi:hopanoid-associated sugar epimerase [Candidatus Nitrosacidococcus tergens]|uniref:Putative dihydroflavonol-4-reductase n=1 Tax=Candidatus Nitrosacidococcus tergens TaxID=553981 RepID=A0A7G1Q909_9GAMM|nr:hopanoid-associated sugar epimerase [Candidatus Nitrosacidococcus tergens]CAB1275563.1 putative dihydroflavonol-4-reductase [Candidatus Nitrosacidococcus tergens]
MTSLVTGATGFVGSTVAKQLVNLGETVRVFVRPSSNRTNLDNLSVEVFEGDLKDPKSLEKALQGCQSLFHIAADYRLWSRNPQEFYDNNVQGSKNIFLAAAQAGVKRIIYTSSVAALGVNPDRSPADENTPSSLETMIGHYKRSKFLAEEEVKKLTKSLKLDVVIVNPSTPVGPQDIRPTPTGRIITMAASGKIPAYVDTGLNVVHVDDVAAGHLLAFEKGKTGERYILGGENLYLREILEIVARIMNRNPPKIQLPHYVVLPIAYFAQGWAYLTHGKEPMTTVDGVRMAKKHMFFSSKKAEQELGYTHRPAREAISDAIRWFQNHHYI